MVQPAAYAIINKIDSALRLEPQISGPILDTLEAKINGGSLAGHGIDCYNISKFVGLSEEDRLSFAAATELAWACFLIYDDIIDNDSTRYGQPAAWIKYGRAAAENSYERGLEISQALHPFPSKFGKMCAACIQAASRVKELRLTASINAVEQAYYGYRFGYYDYLLPFDDKTRRVLAEIGYRKMLMAQLINDYKDTCGSRRRERNYPELREKQVNYVIALYGHTLSAADGKQFTRSIAQANTPLEYEKVSQAINQQKSTVKDKTKDLARAIYELSAELDDPLKSYIESEITSLNKEYTAILATEFSKQ